MTRKQVCTMHNDINIAQFYGKSLNFTNIPHDLYPKYNVKRGLRNEDKTGVLIGLTRIADVVGYKLDENGKKVDAEGELYYRGINIMDLATQEDADYLYEEASFLLLFGYLPKAATLELYCQGLKDDYELPEGFIETHLLDHPSKNLMNQLQRSILALYNYDDDPDATDPYRTLIKGINIMAKLPSLACYALTAKNHYYGRDSLVLHYPRPDYSTAENILSMLRLDGKFTKEEARVLDVMLLLHADHGGGTNSTFTNVVVSSTDTDIYSALASSIGSLKGPRHGGANVSVAQMMEKVIEHIGMDADEKDIEKVLEELMLGGLDNPSKLVYGIGHAVYTLSDPRAEVIRAEVGKLAREKGEGRKFDFYVRFEETAKRYLSAKKGLHMSSNVDFYSGFAYDLLGIPQDFYTPLFVLARTVGWIAHNVEHKLYDNRIIRPASKYVGELTEYVPRNRR